MPHVVRFASYDCYLHYHHEQVKVELTQTKTELTQAKEELTQASEKAAMLETQLSISTPPSPLAPSKVSAQSPPITKDREKKGKRSVLGAIDLDEGPDAAPISEQIATALRASAGRVMDLFREWDADGDGEITRKEFRKAMPMLGLEVPVSAVDELYDQWDSDGGGAINFKELQRVLNRKGNPSSPSGGAKKPVALAAKTAMAAAKLVKK